MSAFKSFHVLRDASGRPFMASRDPFVDPAIVAQFGRTFDILKEEGWTLTSEDWLVPPAGYRAGVQP